MYKSYHAGASTAAHIPIHGGVAIYNRTVSSFNAATNVRSFEQGTLGCIVTNRVTGKPYILSNQHVMYPSGKKYGIGDLIYESGYPSQAIGRTSQFGHQLFFAANEPYVDAALAEPLVPLSYEIPGVGYIRGMAEPQVGMKVKMLGGRNGFQQGTITATNINQGGIKKGIFGMAIQSDSGDSGSAILNDDNNIVGLMFGALPSAGVGYACTASAIEAKFKIDFAAKSTTVTSPDVPPKTNTSVMPVLPVTVAPTTNQLSAFLTSPTGQQVGMAVIAGLIILAVLK